MQNKGTIVRIVLVALMAYALLHFAAARAELEQTRQLAGALTAEQESLELLARGRRAAEERRERLSSSAAVECRKLELAAKQELLGEAFDAAVEQLCSLPREDYLALIAALAAEAAEGNEKMLLNRHDAEELGAEAILMANTALCAAGKPGKLTLGSETRPIPGGFILSCGDVELNCAFDTLVRLQREKLEKEVAAILFPVQ